MCGFYFRGGIGWVLGFVFFVPWLRSLDASRTVGQTLFLGWVMSIACVIAAGSWLGTAIGNFTQTDALSGISLLLLATPLLLPQFLAFALVRHATGRRYGPLLAAFAGAAAWVAMEWLMRELFGNVLSYALGYGLYPSKVLRQTADIGGAAGITYLLLLTNEGVAAAIARYGSGLRGMVKPLVLAALVPLLMAVYGLFSLATLPANMNKPLRVGLVQSNIVDYEKQRQVKGAYAVVRDVLDTHFAMTYDAVVRQGAEAVLWSETVYPTTFAQPKSAAGNDFDQEILDVVKAVGVPIVFGTYDRDGAGEYNAAAFVEPHTGLLGFYRKTHLFPFTEYVPDWLGGSALHRWLPWAGTWKPGTGPRVFPLRLAEGREVPVLAMICLDAMDAELAINGARLGAQAILTMSNDSWFSDGPGMELLHAAAAFRSIETRLPQFRVTQNGYSAVIDPTGNVLAGARKGERMLVVSSVPVSTPVRTLVVRWGDWVGLAGTVFLVLLASVAALSGFSAFRAERNRKWHETAAPMTSPVTVAVLPTSARLIAGLLRVFGRASLLCMAAAMIFSDTFKGQTLTQIRTFSTVFIIPEVASWFVMYAFAAKASIESGMLVLVRGARRQELPLQSIHKVEPWRIPIPTPGFMLRLSSGERWKYGLATAELISLVQAMVLAKGRAMQVDGVTRMSTYAKVSAAVHYGRLSHPFTKFVLLPTLLAVPAFRLHQHIAFGSSFGEYYMFGLMPYLMAFLIWWASWAIGVVLCAAVLRAGVEVGTLVAVFLRPLNATEIRHWLEKLNLAALYLGLPSWFLLRVYGG
jgi:apolipoprotein N-acyltransferase